MSKCKNTDKEFIEAVKNSRSIRQCLISLGRKETGDAYRVFYNRIKRLNLDISHFTGMGWSRGKTFNSKVPVSDYLSNKKPIQSFKLKNRLIKEGIFQHKCSNCTLEKWLDLPIPLELDHIDGNHDNNLIENLRLLCPNCHSFTDTHAGKNKKNKLLKLRSALAVKPSPNLTPFTLKVSN